ncbi:hypothetical protein, partial [Maricaulis sp.]|uniref:hypothetical protein n=1 Tax=Maricaulis sp. TaxID=1486257 RepID=UPI003A8CE3C1
MKAMVCGVCPGLVCIIASLVDDESVPATCVAIMPLAGHVWGSAIHPGSGFPGWRTAITQQSPQNTQAHFPGGAQRIPATVSGDEGLGVSEHGVEDGYELSG